MLRGFPCRYAKSAPRSSQRDGCQSQPVLRRLAATWSIKLACLISEILSHISCGHTLPARLRSLPGAALLLTKGHGATTLGPTALDAATATWAPHVPAPKEKKVQAGC